MTTKDEAEALLALEREPWFGEGLRFTCTGCGDCCTGSSGAVYLSQADVDRLSKTLDLPVETFLKQYTQGSDSQIALVDRPGSSDCVFLSGTSCSIYDARPTQCRTYPFWLMNILSPEDWTGAALFCEGINHADAPLVTPSQIFEQCRSDLENEALNQ